MKKNNFTFLLSLLGFVFVSCNQIAEIEVETINKNQTVAEVAKNYITYKYIWNNFENNKSAISEEIVYPDSLYNLKII